MTIDKPPEPDRNLMTTIRRRAKSSGDASSGTAGDGAAGTRRKLTDAQEAEVTRLYAETDTPVLEISKRFGIRESSLYRIAQRFGASLRRKAAASDTAAGVTPGTIQSAASRARHEFRVSYVAVRVFMAVDMTDAIQQAEAAGAVEITSIQAL